MWYKNGGTNLYQDVSSNITGTNLRQYKISGISYLRLWY